MKILRSPLTMKILLDRVCGTEDELVLVLNALDSIRCSPEHEELVQWKLDSIVAIIVIYMGFEGLRIFLKKCACTY
jgi:hypothetical protein